MTKKLPLLILPSLMLAAAGAFSHEARACGGFFCSASAPVNQAAEQIVFADNGDGTVTAIIQITYQGPSESFAWVLPVGGIPDVAVSSNSALQSLSRATEPQYMLETSVEGQCMEQQFYPEALAADTLEAPAAGAAEPAVTVLAQGSVGPYDFVVIQPDGDLEDPARVAVGWLGDNGYDTGSIAPDVLGPYLAEGLNLIAFRLTKGNQAGSIRPVMITYDGDKPSIPIRPTAVAATADMGVLVWVLGGSRAIPENYLGLELNDARINWFNWRSNYDDVVSEAADEAGGHGFVTEFAGGSDIAAELIWNSGTDQQWESFNSQTFQTPFDRMDAAASMFRGWDGIRDAIGAAVTLPPGVTLDEFGRNPDMYRDDPDLSIDDEIFQQRLVEWVIEPVRQTQLLIDAHPFMTRLYTTLSPEEMTDDPLFSFNPELPDVSREHQATVTYYCNPNIYQFEAPWRIRLPSGQEFTGEQQQWPIELQAAPANARILELSTSGQPRVLTDNSAMIESTVQSVPVVEGAEPPQNSGGGGDSGCSLVMRSGGKSGTGAGAFALVASLFGLGASTRRRGGRTARRARLSPSGSSHVCSSYESVCRVSTHGSWRRNRYFVSRERGRCTALREELFDR